MNLNNEIAFAQELHLKRALLIYEGNQMQPLATAHEVLEIKNKPVIGPGRTISPKEIQELAMDLLRSSSHGQWLPENILSRSLTRMVWWQPAQRRTLFYKVSEKKINEALHGKKAWHPALVFDTDGHQLSVYAMAENSRPNPVTQLYRAPYCNVMEEGGVQLCGAKIPKDGLSIESMKQWEECFYDTTFTHTAQGRLCNYKGGYLPLWLAAIKGNPRAKKKPGFPVEGMIKYKLLNSIIQG